MSTEPSGSGSSGPTEGDLFGKPGDGNDPAPGADDFVPLTGRPRVGRWIFATGIIAVVLVIAVLAAPSLFKGTSKKPKAVATAPAAPAVAKAVPAVAAPTEPGKAKTPAVAAPTEPAQATAPTEPTAPTGATITLGCSIPEVGSEVVASCEWARDGGVTFENLRWEGEVLMGTLVVTLVDGRVYASNDMAVIIQEKTPTLLAAR